MTAASKNSLHHVRATDLRALTLLATEATQAVTAITEGVHQSVWHTLGAPGGATLEQTRGLTGLIFKSINGVTTMVGQGLAGALIRLEPLLKRLESQGPESPERAAFIAALNGVMGDRLQASANPLATAMTLRQAGAVLEAPGCARQTEVKGRVLLMLHGLCMNDLQWSTESDGKPVNHGTVLARSLGYSPVYLRYNSGLHVSQNGHALAAQLENLLDCWPVPLAQISVLAHSMGGLVMRSALHYARQGGLHWPQHLKHIVFLGTPHHGAPLERVGNWVDLILGSTPYSRPFARLGQLRSAGITDLRYGHLLDLDWQGHDRFQNQPDSRQHLPLPEDVACFAVAASTTAKRSRLADRLLGDGLVPLHSALGEHDDASRQLMFAPGHQYIACRTSHLQLLGSPAVTAQLLRWLS